MLTILVNGQQKTNHWSLLAALLDDAKSIRKQEYPELKYSFGVYKEAYFQLLGSISANWTRKYPEALEKLEEDLETVRSYEYYFKKIPAHLRQAGTVH